MSDTAKIALFRAMGIPTDESGTTKIVLYRAFSNVPVVPVRKKARGAVRFYAEPETY